MEKINKFENFLDLDFIKNLKNKVYSEAGNAIWKSSLAWDISLRKSSAPILINVLTHDKYINEYLKEKYLKIFPELKNKKIHVSYFVHPRLSYLAFHNDYKHFFASTIYLNENWHEDFGGLFLYKEKNEIKAIVPKFNLALTNSNNIEHGTSLITLDAPYRETIQIFFNEI